MKRTYGVKIHIYVFCALTAAAGGAFCGCGGTEANRPPPYVEDLSRFSRCPQSRYVTAVGEAETASEARREAKAQVAEKVVAELKTSLTTRRNTVEEQILNNADGGSERSSSKTVREMIRQTELSADFKFAHLIHIDRQSVAKYSNHYYAIACLSREEAAGALKKELDDAKSKYEAALPKAREALKKKEREDAACWVARLMNAASKWEAAQVQLASIEGSTKELHLKPSYVAETARLKAEADQLSAAQVWRGDI